MILYLLELEGELKEGVIISITNFLIEEVKYLNKY